MFYFVMCICYFFIKMLSSVLLCLLVVGSCLCSSIDACGVAISSNEKLQRRLQRRSAPHSAANCTTAQHIKCVWHEAGAAWYVQDGQSLNRIAYRHAHNNCTGENKRAFYAADEFEHWFRIEYPTKDLMNYLRELPAYNGTHELRLREQDLAGDMDVPVVQEEHLDEGGKQFEANLEQVMDFANLPFMNTTERSRVGL